MAEEPRFKVELVHVQDMEFRVTFDWDTVSELVMDEPEPIGHRKGANASRVLAAAVGNCLTASLLFCLKRSKAQPTGMKTEVSGVLIRNEKNRLRVGDLDVRIQVEGMGEHASQLQRCTDLFEDFCVVSASVRNGVPIRVQVVDESGTEIVPRD